MTVYNLYIVLMVLMDTYGIMVVFRTNHYIGNGGNGKCRKKYNATDSR